MPKQQKTLAKTSDNKKIIKKKSEDDKAMNSFEESYSDDEEVTDTNAENSDNSDSSEGSDDSDESDNEVSDVSDSDNDNDYEDGGEEKLIKNKFLENVVKYLKTDDLLKKKQKEHKEELQTLKDDKNELEGFILRYLDRKGENYVEIKGNGKLIKNKSETKSAIKAENIREGILDGLKAEKLIEKEEETLEIINKIMDIIDNKRTVTTRTYLKRTKEQKKKGKKEKGKKGKKA